MTVENFLCEARSREEICCVALARRLKVSRQVTHKTLKKDLDRVLVGTLRRYARASGVRGKLLI